MIDRICLLLDSDNAEVQCAAATILGELKPKEKEVRKALEKALRDRNDMIQAYALAALEKIGIDASLPKIIPLLGGPRGLKSRATALLAGAGTRAEKLLRERLAKASPAERKGILDVLGHSGGAETLDTLITSMLDDDFEVVRQASQSLIEQAKQMPEKKKASVSKDVVAFLKQPKAKKKEAALVGGIKVLGYLGVPTSIPMLLSFLGAKNSPKIRTHALNSLAHIEPGKQEKAVAKKLFPLLEEKDGEIVERTLRILRKIPPLPDATDRLIRMLSKGTTTAIRVFAARSLGHLGSQKAAKSLLEVLLSEDAQLSGAAGSAFRSNPRFSTVLIGALNREKDAKRAWKIANIVRTFGKELGKPVLRQFLQKCIGLIRKRDPGMQVYFELLRGSAPDLLQAAILKEGRTLLRKKKYEDAEHFLRLLDRDDMESDDAMLALAVSRLATMRKDLAQAHRDRSHAITLFLRLARREKFLLAKQLQKETALKADDLLYLGFCLTERVGVEREVGGQILKYVAKKYAAKNEGKIAKKKLSTQGFRG